MRKQKPIAHLVLDIQAKTLEEAHDQLEDQVNAAWPAIEALQRAWCAKHRCPIPGCRDPGTGRICDHPWRKYGAARHK